MSKADFIRGYYCAVAVLLKEEGLNTHSESLFRQGGSKAAILLCADKQDIETMKQHGLFDDKPVKKPYRTDSGWDNFKMEDLMGNG